MRDPPGCDNVEVIAPVDGSPDDPDDGKSHGKEAQRETGIAIAREMVGRIRDRIAGIQVSRVPARIRNPNQIAQ